MHIETLLPLGKVDPGLRTPEVRLDLQTVAAGAAHVESLGFSGLVTEETRDDPFIILSLAAAATTTLKLGTAVAIAFARSPTSMAMSAWSLQKLSRGRFTLGLGPQVRAHVMRRFGMPAHPAAASMREYVHAVRNLWNHWQYGSPLDIRGEYYNIDLSVPLFNPGPIARPDIPIHLAAVNPLMCRTAGEVADGIRPHPVCTPSYIEHVMLPAVREGARKAGRSLDRFDVCMKPLIATAPDDEQLAPAVRDARARIAFYASTPSYARAFAHESLEELAAEAKILSRAQRWEELPNLVSDEVLNRFVVVGTHAEIGQRLLDRFGSVVTQAEFSTRAQTPEEALQLTTTIHRLQNESTAGARARIAGATV